MADEINYEELGRIAFCSSCHFQRMFGYMAGLPLSEYIRRRKMSLAAVDLQSGEKIIDVAIKYGYSSPTAFNRAFQSVHGVAPSAVKSKGVAVKSYLPITFHITIKGAEEMDYRIERKEAFRIIGVFIPLDKDVEKNHLEVPKLWQKAAVDGSIDKLACMMDTGIKGMLGICACGSAEEWKYFIAAASTQPAGEGMEEYHVPASTWAIFPGDGICPQAIQELEQHIMTEWLPASGYEYADGPDVELYFSPDPYNARYEENIMCLICDRIQVIKAGKTITL